MFCMIKLSVFFILYSDNNCIYFTNIAVFVSNILNVLDCFFFNLKPSIKLQSMYTATVKSYKKNLGWILSLWAFPCSASGVYWKGLYA